MNCFKLIDLHNGLNKQGGEIIPRVNAYLDLMYHTLCKPREERILEMHERK